MFDSLLKPKFYSKCKACLRLIKRRLDNIQKKRNAVQKFLKKDIVDLLRNGLDYNAYGRAEGLFVEQNMSDCYDLIAKFVECIYTRVGDLTKCRDCPDECKQAIASLIYAAARFSDLPELRELRTLFTEKFGKSLEVYTSKEFIEKWKQHHPSKEMKIHLLHDLAQEFSINWDAKTLEQRLYSPASSHEQEKPIHDAKLQKKSDDDIKLTSKGNERDVLSQERNKDTSNEWWRVRSSTETKTTTTTTTENSSQNVPKASSSSFEKASEDDEAEFNRPLSYGPPPPPYMIKKFNNGENNSKTEAPSSERDSINSHEPVVVPKKPIPKSVRRRPLKPPLHENTITSSKSIDDAKLDILGVNGNKSEKASDPRDEEEVVLDGLLMHYSKKQSPYQSGTGKIHTKREYSSFSSFKGTSVPRTDMQTLINGHDRATSLVPEMLRTAGGHVHPSLPDYDDFTARLAALRRN